MAGFYSWQTNDELNLQNDAMLYGLGFDLVKNNWTLASSWSGYHGYKDNGDRPMQLNFDLRKDYNYILIDSAPFMLVPDTMVLSAMVDVYS